MGSVKDVDMSCCAACANGAPCESDTVAVSISGLGSSLGLPFIDNAWRGAKDTVAPALDIVYGAVRDVARSKYTMLGVAGLTAVFPPVGASAAAGLAAANGAIAIIDSGRDALKSAGGDVQRLTGSAKRAVGAAAAISAQLKAAETAAADGDSNAALLLSRMREAEVLQTALEWRKSYMDCKVQSRKRTKQLTDAGRRLGACQHASKVNDARLSAIVGKKVDLLRKCLPKSARLEEAYQKELAERKKLQLRWKKYKKLWLAAKSSGPTGGKDGLFFDVATGRVTAGQYAAAGSETPVA